MMGGFRIEGYSNTRTLTAEKSPSTPSTDTHLTVDVLNFHSFVYIMKHFPDIVPDIPEESITDRADSSGLSKAILIIQVAWFCTNCISRRIQHLPLSLLEVSTGAQAFCTLLVYFIWWSKPLNIAEGKRIKGQRAREVHALLACSDQEYSEALSLAERIAAGDSAIPTNNEERVALAANALQNLLPTPEARPLPPFGPHYFSSVPGSSSIASTSHAYYEWTIIAISPMLHGIIHFSVSSDQFPTHLEYLFWIISAVVITCSGLVVVTLLWMGRQLAGVAFRDAAITSKIIIGTTGTLVIVIIALAFFLAFNFITGESFRQLFCLEPAVYQLPSWSNYWPHFS
jgi:hypothetical protein